MPTVVAIISVLASFLIGALGWIILRRNGTIGPPRSGDLPPEHWEIKILEQSRQHTLIMLGLAIIGALHLLSQVRLNGTLNGKR